MRLRVKEFLGISPKTAAHLLDPRQAQLAIDCTLWSHGLQPIGGELAVAPLSKLAGEIQTLYFYQANWLCWNQDVNAVKGPIANDPLDRLYFTGTDKPRVTTSDIWNVAGPGTFTPPHSYILGIPAPLQAPVAGDSGAGNINSAVSWVFTYVRKFSDGTIEESAPSPPSNVLNLANRQASVTLPEDAITFADYGITHKRVYRESNGGNFFFVTEVALGVTPTVDNSAVADLGDAIESTVYLPPPDGMVGLIQLPNFCLAGFKDNVVYISEPGRPHAYPLLNRYVVNDLIVGIGNVGTTIVVATKSVPEFGRGVDPSAYTFRRAPGPFPCSSKRSMKSGDLGVVWATPRGMAISNGADVTMATSDFLTYKEWQAAFAPTTIHGVIHDGRYYGWFSNGSDSAGNKVGGGFVLDKTEKAYLTQLGAYVEAAYAVPDTDQAFISKKVAGVNEVFQFDADPALIAPTPFTWKSKLHIANGIENFAFAQIIADYSSGLTPAQLAALNALVAAISAANALAVDDGFIDGTEINGGDGDVYGELDGDDTTQYLPANFASQVAGLVTWTYWANQVVKQTRVVASNDPFPMPSGFEAQQHEFQVQGQVKIREVVMASSMEELSAEGG